MPQVVDLDATFAANLDVKLTHKPANVCELLSRRKDEQRIRALIGKDAHGRAHGAVAALSCSRTGGIRRSTPRARAPLRCGRTA